MDIPRPPPTAVTATSAPITEADLHAYVDRQLTPARTLQVEQFLALHPDEHERVRDWQQQNALLHGLLDPTLEEPLPLGLPMRPARTPFPWRGLAASVLVATASGALGWSLRGAVGGPGAPVDGTVASAWPETGSAQALTGFARRAAVAHVVYSPDVRRPVEVGADQEQALVSWLTRRMGAEVRPPTLAALGYALIGGRLLPGDKGPVAQFMYASASGQRLTLYVTREVPGASDAEFRFGNDGAVNVFYWVENHFGYAISAGVDRSELMKVSSEVYRQLKPG